MIFQSILIHPKSDMVGTRSSHSLNPPAGALGASNNQDLMEFMKSMAKSMEVFKKQNEDLNTRLTVTEAQNNQKEREHEERRDKER
jgi:hypothetical protein